MEGVDRFGFVVPSRLLPTAREEWRRGRVDRERSVKWLEMLRETEGRDLRKHVKFASRLAKGVPPALRSRVWTLCAAAHESTRAWTRSDTVLGSDVASQIELDLRRTFPTHEYVSGELGRESLRAVLVEYALRDCEVGFCQGMSFVAAFLLCVQPERDASRVFDVVMRAAAFNARAHFRPGLAALRMRVHQFSALFETLAPALCAHFAAQGVAPDMFATQWVMTLLSYSFSFDVVARFFDLFLVEGWPVFFGFAVALLCSDERELLAAPSIDGVFSRLRSYARARFDLDSVARNALAIARVHANDSSLARLEDEWRRRPSAAVVVLPPGDVSSDAAAVV